MMHAFILILLFVCSVATAAEVYRWVDENGETHYSDRPHEGAETVTLPKAQTFTLPARQPSRRSSDAAKDAQDDEQEAGSYRSVEIVSPTPDQVLWNIGGSLKVSVGVQPKLRRGHTLMIYLDGRMVDSLTGSKRQTELTEVYRGEHTLRAEIHDAGGGVVAKGDAVSFTVQQTSIQYPNNPNAPPAPTPFGPGRGG